MTTMMKQKVLGGTMRIDGFGQVVDESADDRVGTEIKMLRYGWRR